jgi:hypothetical protein
MSYTYRIKLVIGKIDNTVCPPDFLDDIFPNFKGEPVIMAPSHCDVTFATPQTPVDLGPLVKVELLSE